MPAPKMDEFCDEVMQLTRQPEFSAIQRRTARRRLRRRAVLGTGMAGVLVVVGGLAAAWPAGGGGSTRLGGTPPSGQPARDPVQWADAADANHLYAVVADCTGCETRLVGSDNGGQTWTVRQSSAFRKTEYPNYEFTDVEVRGPSTLEQTGRIPKSGKPPVTMVSTDGGRTWKPIAADTQPAATVPADGWLEAVAGDDDLAAELRVVDPATRKAHPLATPPSGMHVQEVVRTPDGTGLWVQGLDSTDKKAMVAVSRDRGATWDTHTFDPADPAFRAPTTSPDPSASGAPDVPGLRLFPTLDVVTRNGTVAYAVFGNGKNQWSLRSIDGGRSWTVLNGGDPLPGQLVSDRPSFVRPDGTHVVQMNQGNDQIQAYASADGGSRYVAVDSAGWPQAAVHLTVGGTYIGRNWQTIYRSIDGQNWTTVAPY